MRRNKVLIILFFAISSCNSIMEKSAKKYNIDGIWIMQDTEKMAEFLGLKQKPKGYYCMQINTKNSIIKVKFIYSDAVYTLNFDKMAENRYKIVNNGKVRFFSISSDKISSSKLVFYIHFDDSSKYERNYPYKYDGTKENYNTIDECIKSLEEDYEFAQEEEGELEPDEVR